jgi:hypothetical protein
MPDRIKSGTLMIEEGIALPDSFDLESEPYSAGWRVVTNSEGVGLDKHLRKLGWTFFYIAAPVKVRVFGLGSGRTLRKAFRKMLESAAIPRFNCVEISGAFSQCFLGFAHVYMSGHARDIQPERLP